MKIKETLLEAIGDIQADLLEKRPLPIGMSQFTEWADRIIKKAGIEASERSQKFALCSMILSLGPTEAFHQDGYFVLALRKGAINETVAAVMRQIKEDQQKEMEEKETVADTDPLKIRAVDGVLANQKV